MKLKQLQSIFHVIVNLNSVVQLVFQIKSGITKNVNVNAKIFISVKKDYNWNSSSCIWENSNNLNNATDTSVTKCNKNVVVIHNLSTKKTNTIVANATSNRFLYFAYSLISDHIIDNYYYLLSLCKTKRYNKKWKIMN